MVRPWPLVGRDDELRTIAAAVRPGAPGVLVAGPAGVGKTRLAREALARAGAPVLWAHGSAAARPFPLGAFAGRVEAASEGDATRVVAAVLAEIGARAPLVVSVDDGHLLDELSAIVLHRLVERRVAPVVVTLRTGTAAPDAVTALWKDDLLPRLDLQPLGAEVTAALVAQVLEGPVESRSAQRLWALTEGSPLFLRHLLADEVGSGRFSPASGLWCWTEAPEISPRLGTLLEHEIGALPDAVQDVVDLVALAEPLAVPRLAALTSAAAVEDAEARALVRTDEDDLARLAHPLYGEVRRATMGRLRARRLRGLVARALDATTDPIPRAVLTLDSDLDPDPTLFLRAAEAAIRLYDLPLAERLARAAADDGDWTARLVHAATLSWLSRGEEAESLLRNLVGEVPPGLPRASVQLHRTGNLLWTLARPAAARAALATAREDASEPAAVQLVDSIGAALAASLGDVEVALRDGLALLDSGSADIARLLAASAVAASAAVTGQPDLLDRAATVGGITADRVPTSIPGFGLADWQVLGHRLAGRPERATELAGRMRDASADLPGPARLMGLVLAGHAALAGGHVDDALVVLREAWAGLASSGHEFRCRCRTLLATAYALAGRSEDAAPLLAGLVEEAHPAYRLFAPDDLLAQAWGGAADGAVSGAIRTATRAAELAAELASPAFEVLCLQTVIQLGDPAPLDRLDALAEELRSPRAGAALAHARALAGQDGTALLDAAERWDELGDLVAAGDAAAQAAGVFRDAGRQGSALSAAARAEALARRSGARTPALRTAAQPLPLTAREREIVELAARGLSNRDIADRLTVSVRTVEGHLYRAGHKLGVSDRAALAHLVGDE